jgi:glycosyltransferase involved in cell wall biosynthesis
LTPGSKPGLSVCIIALNEEERLPRCLEALRFADEIIIVDGGSSDRTIEVAKHIAPSAHINVRKFDDFVSQKNFAISLAACSWILVVDADEVVTPELQGEVERVVEGGGPENGFKIPRMTHYLGRWIRHCGWYPDYNIRLFRQGYARFEGGTVHERAQVQGPVGVLRAHLQHFSYRSISDHLTRIDRYSTLIADDKYRKGDRSSPLWAIYKSVSKFLLVYFWKAGFLDGQAGLVVAVLGGYYNFLKYIKLWEIRKGLRRPAV